MKVKNKIYNSQLQKNVVLARVMALNLDQVQIDAPIVGVMGELELTKVFLQSNKLVLNVLVVVKK